MYVVRVLPIAVAACGVAWGAGAAAGEPVPTMAAGVYTAPADVARCTAMWEAYASGKSIRVQPPARTLKLRDKPAKFARWTDRRKSELQGLLPLEGAPSCTLPFLASPPADKAPVFDRLTGLVWLGE